MSFGLKITGKQDARVLYGSAAPFVDDAAIEYGRKETQRRS